MSQRSSFAACATVLVLGALAPTGVAAQPRSARAAKLGIGDRAPAWSKLPDVDGKLRSLSDLKDRAAVVVVFTCNSCGYSTDYENRINAFAKKYTLGDEAKVALVAINVNTVEEDRPPAMKARAKSKGYVFPYLYDESQRIARDFGTLYTPTFFVLDRDRKLVYKGCMDDATNPKRVSVNYVERAVEAVLAGTKPEITEKPAIGCRVRYDDGRRRRRGREPGTPLKPEPSR